ncbi:MAG: class I SAM-dependent methyltransferase [Deltaproteobacteria bacterium]|nr:class I SAM-dependent methyltransferase [Candidatus Zymogenaceae bacterium]
MSTYVLMKILESSPDRYDRGIRFLTLGQLDEAYDRLTSHIRPGDRVLDIGCGTGALTLRALARGGVVTAMDINPAMMDVAKKKVGAYRAEIGEAAGDMVFLEMGVAEMDDLETGGYNVVMSGLCFSELTDDETAYALGHVHRILKNRGMLLIGDEVPPGGIFRRFFYMLVRIPLAALTYLVTQTTTGAIKNLESRVASANLEIESVRRHGIGGFMELIARKRD